MKHERLNELVIEESKNLKANATSVELRRLAFDNLIPTNHNGCIYGQMTGSCFTKRADTLITKCASKLITGTIGTIMTKLRACNEIEKFGDTRELDDTKYWSPIEMFIVQKRNIKNGNNKRLISYLRGETETLIIK